MATVGGKRTGAGRPKKGEVRAPKAGPDTTKIFAKATIGQVGKARLAERLIDKVVAMEITPLEVMLNTMKLHYDSAQTALKERELVEEREKQEVLLRFAKACMGESSAVAEKVAPYLHAKLQAVTIKGDKDHPLNLTTTNFKGLSDEELATMQALMAKASGE